MSASTTSLGNNALATDIRNLDGLKHAGATPAAAREAAKQFESLFMHEMIKSMRQATMKSGLLDDDSGNLATDMLDQQLAVSMSGLPGGLSEMIEQQLSARMGGATTELTAPSTLSLARSRSPMARSALTRTPGAQAVSGETAKGRDAFVAFHTAAAERVAERTGIPAAFMIGQAGHETGWGKSEIRNADGSNSHNLFGIKAGGSWKGKVAEITTTEYIDGVARKVTAKFRAYDSFEESFADYARLISENPRYARAMQNTHSATAYATELQKAGYATDPAYARKLSGAISSAMRAQGDQA